MSCSFCCCLVFLEGCLLFVLFVCVCLVFLSVCMYKRNKSSKNKQNTKSLREKKQSTTKIQLIQPEPERYLFAVEWWAGCPVLFVCCFVSKAFCFVCFDVVFVCVCLVCLSFCMYKRHNQVNTLKQTNKQARNYIISQLMPLMSSKFFPAYVIACACTSDNIIGNHMTFAADPKGVFVALK